ncbi:MAG: biopolymer transporter ExbD [Planctomycetota bacterium]
MPIKFYCRKCGQRLSVASKKAGKSVSCPACHSRISIPLESEDRRPEIIEKAPITAPQVEKHPETVTAIEQEENQLLDDLDDLGPLGESWDELLDEDWDRASATEEAVQPSANIPVQDEKITPEKQEPLREKEPPPEKSVAQPPVQSLPSEPVAAAVETEIKTPANQAAAASSTVAVVEEDDEDDDDDGFSIRSAESEFEEMDLTPMVDVTFLLLIFFMITASFSLQKSIQVPPPNPDEDGVSQSLQTLDDFREESIIVEIDRNNAIYVDDTKLSNPSDIVQAILDRRNQDGKPKSELVLSAHKAARHETVVAVVDAANEVGMQKIRLASYRGPED